jgi:aspartyl protease family protein
MRALFIMMAGIGFLSALMSRAPSRTQFDQPKMLSDARDAEERQIAELKAKDAAQFTSNDGSVELRRSPDGHFYADVQINGSYVHMLVDTGASSIALSRQDARKAGLATSIAMNDVVGQGANGAVHGEFARLDRVELGPLSAQGLDAIVLSNGEQSLLGQSFLSKFASVRIEGDRMILR